MAHRPFRLQLPPDFWSARAARRELADILGRLRWQRRADAAELIVSELVTNAVQHAGTEIEVSVELANGTLRLEVTDFGGGVPRRREVRLGDPGGRGLNVVSFLATEWGTTVQPGRTTVWCTLD